MDLKALYRDATLVGDDLLVRDGNGKLIAMYDAFELAQIWFRTSNDAFFDTYGFNWVPRGDLFDRAKAAVEAREMAAMQSSIGPSMNIMPGGPVISERNFAAPSASDIAEAIRSSINGGAFEGLTKSIRGGK